MPDSSSIARQDNVAARPPESFFAGGGEMGERIRAFDWSNSPIGPVESWSPALRMIVRFLLANRFPMLLWWGPQYVSIYNDHYAPILGAKHPWALSRPVSECWSEIWHILRPLIDTPFNGGPPTWNEDLFVEINRHGYIEEGHFTVAYSPVPDDTVPSGIGGVLATVHEITGKVLAERRVVVLRDLGARVGEATSAERACAIVAETLAAHRKDVPFALLYLVDPDRTCARLAGTAGVRAGEPVSPVSVDLLEAHGSAWPFSEALRTEAIHVVENLEQRFPGTVPPGPWANPPHTAVVISIPSNKAHEPAGVIVAGVSARLRLDEYYREFFELVRARVATSIANARAYEEEKRRAEALAEIDRAKTAFFSNVSHEFRTPLTLLLAPMEDILRNEGDEIVPQNRELLQVAYRNGIRLQKLVNTLLDFSRIEAGRVDAAYEPTDVAALTKDLASNFRSACERAGIRMVIDCPPVGEPVYVDRDMWEKIVLNLLSNAFKFTFEGEIAVTLRSTEDDVELIVRDTGTGIPTDELVRIFERFYRVRTSRGRTHEGTGIGLSLVQELVKLHGGTLRVDSVPGSGSSFTVSIPKGRSHLPRDRIFASHTLASTSLGASTFVEEALRWLPDAASKGSATPLDGGIGLASGNPTYELPPLPTPVVADTHRARILWADDNADMREYVRGLLDRRYEVRAVSDGHAALAAARSDPPDLILADVMMPRLDGFELLRALRADTVTRAIPVMLLSARAGEEARIEGMQAGADDYIVKPFSARELVARIAARLELHALARRLEDERAAMLTDALRSREEFLAMASHELRNPVNALQLQLVALLRAIEKRGRPVSSAWAGDRVGQAVAAVRRLTQLVDTLLDVSQIRAGRLDLEPEEVDLGHAIHVVLHRFKDQLVNRQVITRITPATGSWDRLRLEQIVTNLVSNAIKYGEGRPIEISLEAEESVAFLSVTDHGIGIHEEDQARLFEQFERAVSRRHYGGFGLGLWITRQLVHAMGGEISVQSRPGEGSTFRVELPRAATVATGDAPHIG